jgi:hypothetical protein
MALNEYSRYRLKDLAEWFEITESEAAAMAEHFEQTGPHFARFKIGAVWMLTERCFQQTYDWMRQSGRFSQ